MNACCKKNFYTNFYEQENVSFQYLNGQVSDILKTLEKRRYLYSDNERAGLDIWIHSNNPCLPKLISVSPIGLYLSEKNEIKLKIFNHAQDNTVVETIDISQVLLSDYVDLVNCIGIAEPETRFAEVKGSYKRSNLIAERAIFYELSGKLNQEPEITFDNGGLDIPNVIINSDTKIDIINFNIIKVKAIYDPQTDDKSVVVFINDVDREVKYPVSILSQEALEYILLEIMKKKTTR